MGVWHVLKLPLSINGRSDEAMSILRSVCEMSEEKEINWIKTFAPLVYIYLFAAKPSWHVLLLRLFCCVYISIIGACLLARQIYHYHANKPMNCFELLLSAFDVNSTLLSRSLEASCLCHCTWKVFISVRSMNCIFFLKAPSFVFVDQRTRMTMRRMCIIWPCPNSRTHT